MGSIGCAGTVGEVLAIKSTCTEHPMANLGEVSCVQGVLVNLNTFIQGANGLAHSGRSLVFSGSIGKARWISQPSYAVGRTLCGILWSSAPIA